MFTIGWEGRCHVVRVGGSIVVIVMTAIAGIGGVVVIAVVAAHTVVGNGNVGTLESPELTVIKSGRRPRRFSVTFLAISRELIGYVIGIGRCIEIIIMTAIAGIGGVVVIAVVAGSTVVGNVGMGPV